MGDTVYKFSGIVQVTPIVPLSELSENDREVAEQTNFEIGVEIIDVADYDPESGESLEVWALLNEFHEQVAIEVLDYFNIRVVTTGNDLDEEAPL